MTQPVVVGPFDEPDPSPAAAPDPADGDGAGLFDGTSQLDSLAHHLLLLLAGRVPDAELLACRATLAAAGWRAAAEQLVPVLVGHGVPLTDDERVLLVELREDGLLPPELPVDRLVPLPEGGQPPLALRFGRDRPVEADHGPLPPVPAAGPTAPVEPDAVDVAAIAAAEAEPTVMTLRRAWRWPDRRGAWCGLPVDLPGTVRLLLVEARPADAGSADSPPAVAERIQDTVTAAAAEAGETPPLVDVFETGTPLGAYHQAADAVGALLWSDPDDPGEDLDDDEDGWPGPVPVLTNGGLPLLPAAGTPGGPGGPGGGTLADPLLRARWHALLGRLSGRVPAAVTVEARAALAAGDLPETARVAARAVTGGRVGLPDGDVALLLDALPPAGDDGTAERDALGWLRLGPEPGWYELGGGTLDAFTPHHPEREEGDGPDATDLALADALRGRPGVVAALRTWWVPEDVPQDAGPGTPGRVVLVQVDPAGLPGGNGEHPLDRLAPLAGELAELLARPGELPPLVEVFAEIDELAPFALLALEEARPLEPAGPGEERQG